jgi:prevent-host-death family protein
METVTSRDFNRDVSGAKAKADKGPVIVTDRGHPAYVLLRYDEFQRLAGGGRSIADALDDPDTDDIEFDPPRLSLSVSPAELRD